jgi:hypothetical protein
VHRVVLVEAAPDPLRFFTPQVAASPLEPAQFSLARDLEPLGCCFVCPHLGHDTPLPFVSNAEICIPQTDFDPLLVSSTASFPPASTVAFPSFCLAESDAPLLTIGNEKAFLPYVAQHALTLHLLSKALEKLLW